MTDAKRSKAAVLFDVAGPGSLLASAGGSLWCGPEGEEASGIPTAGAFSPDGSAAAVAADPKKLVLFSVEESKGSSKHECGFRAVLQVTAPKRLACVTFSKNGEHVLFADRFGDVHSVNVSEVLAQSRKDPSQPCVTRTLTDDAAPLLGHFSTVTDVAVSVDLIATGDRENRIRISHYPRAYDISLFCFGHSAFVTRLAWTSNGLLLSGAGDGTVRLWDPTSGTELACLSLPRPEGSSDPGVVTSLSLSDASPSLGAVLVHKVPRVFVISGWLDRSLRLSCSFEPNSCHGKPPNVPTGAGFDASGSLWLSVDGSSCIASYSMPTGCGDGTPDLGPISPVTHLEVDELSKKVNGLAMNADAVEYATPGDWLASLRKNTFDPTWKGKGQKRQRGESWLKKKNDGAGSEAPHPENAGEDVSMQKSVDS